MTQFDYGHDVTFVTNPGHLDKKSNLLHSGLEESDLLTPAEYEETHEMGERSQLQRNLATPVQVFVDMAKDAKNTFKPYKGSYYLGRDLLQVVKGIGNVILGGVLLAGLLTLAALIIGFTVPFCILFSPFLIRKLLDDYSEDKDKTIESMQSKRTFILNMTLGITSAITLTFRGLTQIAFTPLTLLIKIPLRCGITLLNKGWSKIEDDETVKQLVTKARSLSTSDKDISSKIAIMKALNIKLHSGQDHKRETNISIKDAKGCYTAVMSKWKPTGFAAYISSPEFDQTNFNKFLNLFSPKTKVEGVKQAKVENVNNCTIF